MPKYRILFHSNKTFKIDIEAPNKRKAVAKAKKRLNSEEEFIVNFRGIGKCANVITHISQLNQDNEQTETDCGDSAMARQ